MRFKSIPCDKCGGKVRDTQTGYTCNKCINLTKSIKESLEDTVRNIVLNIEEMHDRHLTRILALKEVGRVMAKVADKIKVDALTEERGEKRIAEARNVMDKALDALSYYYKGDSTAAADWIIESLSEYEELREALSYLHLQDGESANGEKAN